jgi:hypothetical protein
MKVAEQLEQGPWRPFYKAIQIPYNQNFPYVILKLDRLLKENIHYA